MNSPGGSPLSRTPHGETEPLLDAVQKKVTRAKPQLIAAGKRPACHHCGQSLPRDGWRTARDLVRTVFAAPEWGAGDGSAISLALYDLLDAGVFERDDDTMQVRLAR